MKGNRDPDSRIIQDYRKNESDDPSCPYTFHNFLGVCFSWYKVASLFYLSPVISIILDLYWLDMVPTLLSLSGSMTDISGVFHFQKTSIRD